MTTELIERARAGDSEAFRLLTEPHRRELQVHCYRMLGSLQDAEDMVQNTLLAAWQGLADFESRASIRTWLYRIATNQCLSALRAAKRRPAKEVDISTFDLPEPTHVGEIVWLEPFPDHLLEGTESWVLGPEARYEQQESISLAFVTALQVLPARQRAVLILREVLGYPAGEVAAMMDTTVESVNSALKRARAALQRRQLDDDNAALTPNSPAERALVTKFVHAYQSGDVDALVDLLTADVRVSMPPIPLEYHGRDAVRRFYASIFRTREYALVPTRANGQPAFGAYLRTDTGAIRRAAGLLVLSVAGNRIYGLTRFDNDVLPWFGLPRTLRG
ncbi:MAG: sigma-70 family RNA polymerase sigma factor [Mycobacterium sp.]|uniref:sigma-70 family RNA polymerase sigma factor n=1 Tax=Mycobacterium sp. TaxID=1785 RepID=UPI001ED1508D|nr:sigma-70 family RNA polymerase sigma factor [Mycobacterium sp.]MBV8788963.1 sigma-70 family RNA polymerase sigma factor [Mycobacterium sp.]